MGNVHFDFEMVLFIAVIVTFTAWLIHRKNRNAAQTRSIFRINAALAGFFPLLLLVLSVRGFAFEPFRIPSSSMMPTLLTGDFIYVDKSAYGIKMPVFHNTLIETGHPEKGDVFVFRSVEDPSIDVIKRVMGTPGDRIHYQQKNKRLYVNNELVYQSQATPYEGFTDDINRDGLMQHQETINGVEHIMLTSQLVHYRYPYPYTDLIVPEGHYFAMGDNRDFSSDSRVFGLVPEKNIVGQARFIWMHWRPSDFIKGLKRIGNSL